MNPSDKKPGVSSIASKVAARKAEEDAALATRQAEKPPKRTDARDGKPKPLDVVKLEISDADVLAYLQENRAGDAKLYCRLHRGTVVFVKYWERFLVWAGHHWQEDDYDLACQRIHDVCDLYQRLAQNYQTLIDECDDKDERAKLENVLSMATRRVNLLRDTPGQDNLLKQLRRIRDPLVVLPKSFDTHHYVKACPNGVIDLRSGDLRPGKDTDYMLKNIVTEYDNSLLAAEDPCPESSAFLLRSMDGKQELVDFIWRLLGYGLITQRSDHIFVIFWGEHGRNGKDTLIKLVTHVLGLDMSGDVPVEMFLQMQQTRNSSQPAPDIMSLRGMCLAWINEAEEGQRFAVSKLKKLTGGGYITARGLLDKLQTTWLQTHLPIMTTNELPKAKADDNAFWQRVLLVKWPLSFVDDPQEPYERKADKGLDDKLKLEAKGVLARMVRGAMDYLRDGLQVPDQVKEWTKEQRANWDDVGAFITEWCDVEPHEKNPDNYRTRTSAKRLHDAFSRWYSDNRDSKYGVSSKKFAEMLNKKDVPYKRSDGSWRLGITLNAEALAIMAGGQQ